MGVLGIIFAPELIALFRNDPEVVAVGARALRLQCATFPLTGWVVFSNMTLQTIGDTGPATLLAGARQGVFFIPAVLLLPRLMELWGVMLAQPLADVLTFAADASRAASDEAGGGSRTVTFPGKQLTISPGLDTIRIR